MGGLYYICAFTIAFGFSTGSQIIMARRNGERNYKEVGPVMIQGVFFLLMLAAVMFTLSRLFAGILCGTDSSDTILNATEEFLDWRVFGFFFSFVNVMFRAFLSVLPDEGADTECCCDGVDECAAGLPADIR